MCGNLHQRSFQYAMRHDFMNGKPHTIVWRWKIHWGSNGFQFYQLAYVVVGLAFGYF